jgi:archaetidylinositol phosphate synthase
MLTKLKQKFQAYIASVAKAAHRVGLTPNRISAIGIAFAFLSAFAYWKWHLFSQILLIVAPIFLLISGFFDALDGVVARLYGQTTAFGGFLDSLLDRYADAVILVGIILGGLCSLELGLVALVGSLLVSYTRARAEAEGVKMEAIGLAERAERMIILAAASFVAIVWKEALTTTGWKEALNWAIIILAILTNFTVLQRAYYFYKASKRKQE